MYTSYTYIDFLLCTGIADLVSVKRFLKNLVDWQSLGLELGLLYTTLEIIEKEQPRNVTNCKTKMLAAWLQQHDNVIQNGVPSWSVLRTALQEIGENELASEISRELYRTASVLVCVGCLSYRRSNTASLTTIYYHYKLLKDKKLWHL